MKKASTITLQQQQQLLLLLLWSLSVFTTVWASTHPNDVEALMQVKAALDPTTIDATSCVGSWDFSIDPCDNRFGQSFTCGIDCAVDNTYDTGNITSPNRSSAGLHQRVTSLKLDNYGYGGELSPWVGNLTALQFLQVSSNSLTGNIPETIGKLTQLVILDMSFNFFSGSITDAIGRLSNLQTLNLAHNNLEGVLPPSLSSLSSITELRFESNRLTGTIPDIRELKLLQILDVSDNRLYGKFPRALPKSLCVLSLRNNYMRGKIPKTIYDLDQLNVLDLSFNGFDGCVNDVLLAHPSLQQLNLSSNKLTQIKAHGAHIIHSSMVALDLSYNLISGPLPSFFTQMRQLSSLSLRYNLLHGTIPPSYGAKAMASGMATKPLRRLMLDGNYLTGPLPAPFMTVDSDRAMAASFVDNCFPDCPTQYAFCQGKDQKTEILCRLFNASP